MLHNVEIPEEEGSSSPWAKTHGQEFAGLRIPLGAKVRFILHPPSVRPISSGLAI